MHTAFKLYSRQVIMLASRYMSVQWADSLRIAGYRWSDTSSAEGITPGELRRKPGGVVSPEKKLKTFSVYSLYRSMIPA